MTQATVAELQTQFDTLKGSFQTQENVVEARYKEQTKNANILEALKQELSELLQRTQGKLERGETLTADEYVELKQSDTGLKARIEYYQALAEDFECLVYNERKKLFDIQQQMNVIRSQIFSQEGVSKLKEFAKNNQEILDEIFTLIYFSNKFSVNANPHLGKEESILTFMQSYITANINRSPKPPVEFSLHSKFLAEFTAKRPTEIHKASFKNEPQGLSKLLKNLTEAQ